MRALLVLLALAACETPNARLIYTFSNGASQSCGSADCADIIIPCDAVMSIRILRPSDPTAPLLTICEPLPQNRNKDLCAVGAVDLAEQPIELPKETLDVQVAVWARKDVFDPETNSLDCGRNELRFDAIDGFPLAQSPSPAVGGHTYYHPGDDEIRVMLGCTDLTALRTCSASSSVEVSATVESFENIGVPFSKSDGGRMLVSVGEPRLEGGSTVHSLGLMDVHDLALDTTVPTIALWKSIVNATFIDAACLQVFEDIAQATATLTCTRSGIPPEGSTLGLGGVLLPKPTLDQVLAALALPQFPPSGITIGIVVDAIGVPVAGETVTAQPMGEGTATIRYLNASRSGFGGTTTTASGIFVSLDAPFGTTFSISGGAEAKVGGRVQDKATIVVLEK